MRTIPGVTSAYLEVLKFLEGLDPRHTTSSVNSVSFKWRRCRGGELRKKKEKKDHSLKELCTRKRSFKPHMKVQLPSSVSALFESQLPINCRDPGSFTIPCTIGRTIIPHALLDLGAAINVMPKSLYRALGLKTLQLEPVIWVGPRVMGLPVPTRGSDGQGQNGPF